MDFKRVKTAFGVSCSLALLVPSASAMASPNDGSSSSPTTSLTRATEPASQSPATDAPGMLASPRQLGSARADHNPTAPATTTKPAARGDVAVSKRNARLAKSRLVWGFAALGEGSPVRGATVTVRSLKGKPLHAALASRRTEKNGFYLVSRLGLPKRFVVEISGGKAVLKTKKKRKTKRITVGNDTTLMAAVAAPKPKQRNTFADVTLGTTIAARVGIERWGNAANSRAVRYAKRSLGMPAWTELGHSDHYLRRYVDPSNVDKLRRQSKGLDRLIGRIVKRAKRGKKSPVKLGTRIPAAVTSSLFKARSADANVHTRIAFGEFADSAAIIGTALGIYSLFAPDSVDSEILDELQVISDQLQQIENTLTTIQGDLVTMQDDMNTQFATLSLQLANSNYQQISSQFQTLSGQVIYAVQQLQNANNLAGMITEPNSSSAAIPTSLAKGMLNNDLKTLNSTLTNFSNTGFSETLQANIVGPSGLLSSLWNLIAQERATATPTASGATALADTKLLTHENYDAFLPVASQAYWAQSQLAALMVNYQVSQAQLGLSNPSQLWSFTATQMRPTQSTQAAIDMTVNGICGSFPNLAACPSNSPAAGSFGSYLKVIATAVPQKTVGIKEALDPTTSTMWGNFGTATWNSVGSKPADSSSVNDPMNLPPTVNVTCNGSTRTLRLDQDFFNTVNGSDGGCSWPNAPKLSPDNGATDPASNWQILASDNSSGTSAILGGVSSTMNTAGQGLYSQINIANNNQNPNPSAGITGANGLDFTSPSLFPNNSGWGRLIYSAGQWTQYMWANANDGYDSIGCPRFNAIGTLAPRTPAGDFFAFDISNPTQPSMQKRGGDSGGAVPDVPGQYVTVQSPQYGNPYPSLFASDLDTSVAQFAIDHAPQLIGNFGLGDCGSFGSNASFTAPLTGGNIAGLAAPWWPAANLSQDNETWTQGPPTPGCATYNLTDYMQSNNYVYVSSAAPATGCTASVIGTRSVKMSDYTWNQPLSIG